MTDKNWIDTPTSSNIIGFGYDPATQELTVKFHGGRSYTYTGVPKHIYTGMKGTDSVGKFFSSKIKDVFPFTKDD